MFSLFAFFDITGPVNTTSDKFLNISLSEIATFVFLLVAAAILFLFLTRKRK